MGQQVGRMPDTWEELIEERDRVLHWSSEVIARVADNIRDEDTFLMDYDNTKLDAKVDSWIENNKTRIEPTISKLPSSKSECTDLISAATAKICDETKQKMRKDYESAYGDLKKFTKRVDELGQDEQKIHNEIQQLEGSCANDVKKFQKKFGPLRLKVFNNLRTGEKMLFEDKKLKTAFTKKIYDIDHKYMNDCAKKFDKLTKDYEKCVAGK
ncbi:uncharacterized protein LOC107271926 [Cephus cinctus]|uniref:Uncharacterized protein LOC107271926 n=1 Tax=Cephus cinctus TaxID=211228 RepID=A0AAJ7RRY0_CEPCN|nr:uncharacterized protein LOC107271926 [Cephus cinctus]XP_024946000.1 uncharacterized protein LOC107271926 [Cephus cinctus]